MDKKRFLISGGGTGGHIYPAIAIAQELKNRYTNADFLFIGAIGKMEMEKVAQAGFPIKGLWISGLQRKLTFSNFMFPFKLIFSLIRAIIILLQFKPDVAIGTGGFASGPALKAASILNIPYVLQEQNSYAGITNKWLARKAKKIFVAFDEMHRFFPANLVYFTGNPIRQNITHLSKSKEMAAAHFHLDFGVFTILVLGGSQGARAMNELIRNNMDFFKKNQVQLLWQCGNLYWEEFKKFQTQGVKVLPFIKEMDMAYAAADLIISRAGAGSVSELAVVGKPVVFIPSPNVAENHQVHNAEALVSNYAAVMIEEKDLELRFKSVMTDLIQNQNKREVLSKNLIKMAKPEATKKIVDEIVQLIL